MWIENPLTIDLIFQGIVYCVVSRGNSLLSKHKIVIHHPAA